MTKQNYLTFKEDLKKSIECSRLGSKHTKAYWNDGFSLQEEQNKAIDEDLAKANEISKTMAKPKNCYMAYSHAAHIAYYIAKHQLTEEEQKFYINDALLKTRKVKEYYNPQYMFNLQKTKVLEYLKEYGDE